MTLFIDNLDVEKVLTMPECMDALEQAHQELGHGRAVNGPCSRILTPRDAYQIEEAVGPVYHVYTSLTASIAKWNVVCNRVDSDFIDYPIVNGRQREVRLPGPKSNKFCGFVKLYDSMTCEPIAIVHDGYLQKFRVAGTEGLGTKYLAKNGAKILALIGSGWQASAAILAHCEAREFKEIKVYSPTKVNRERFARTWSEELGVNIRAVDSCEEAVRGSDVINTVTNALDPMVKTEWIEPGMLIITLKDSNELELATLEMADLLVFNRMGDHWNRYAVGGFEGFPEHNKEYWGQGDKIDWDNMAILGDIMVGKREGRTSDDQVAVLSVRGDGIQFAAVAYRVYQLAQAQGLGTEVDTDLWLQGREFIP